MRTAGDAFASPEHITEVVTQLLRSDSRHTVIIDRALLQQLRADLPQGLRARVQAL
jgi:hypothetical protein